MKIVHVVPSFGLGGMEKVLCTIINATSDRYQHSLVALDNRTDAVQWCPAAPPTIIAFHKAPQRRVFFRDLYRIIHVQRPQMLLTYNWGATDAIWLGRLAGIARIIHHEHGFNVDEAHTLSWHRDLMRFGVYRLARKVVVVSQDLVRMMRTKFALQDRQVAFIPNGIDATRYVQDPVGRARMRATLGYQESDFVVGFSGRLDPVKNLDLMAHTMATCLRHRRDFRWLLIGEGPEKARLMALCEALQIQDWVKFVGQTDDVLPYLRALDAFVLTSYREQMPLTILEAMAVGLPVVASQVGEIPQVIADGHDGFVLSPQAPPTAWAERLLALHRDPDRLACGVRARHKVLSQFQQSTMVQRYQQLLEQVWRS